MNRIEAARRRAEARADRDLLTQLKADAARRPEDLPAMVETLQAEFPDLFRALAPLTVAWEPFVLIRRPLNAWWDDWRRRIEVNPLISAALLRSTLLHELCHAAAGELGHGLAFQRLLQELVMRGETWAAMELREYATKGTPEEQVEAAVRAAAGRQRQRTAPTESPAPRRAGDGAPGVTRI